MEPVRVDALYPGNLDEHLLIDRDNQTLILVSAPQISRVACPLTSLRQFLEVPGGEILQMSNLLIMAGVRIRPGEPTGVIFLHRVIPSTQVMVGQDNLLQALRQLGV